MEKLKNKRILSFVIWVLIAVVSIMTMPNLAQLVRDKGQISLPEDSQSIKAQHILKEMDKTDSEHYQVIAVFTSKDSKPLTKKEKSAIRSAIKELKENDQKLGITDIVSHLDNKETKEQLTSNDGTTILTQITVDQDHGTITKVRNEIQKIVKMKEVKTYLTGSDLVMEDFVQSTEKGIQKTEIIAIIFIVLVLILVFRSPIVPFISLITVGISYLVSLSIVAHLVDKLNFPFSNFTQVFLVVVLFGIGTDYNILLYTRFKEELAHKEGDKLAAIKATYQTAGKTVIFSGMAVLIGFMALYLAKFRLYQATSAVAVGVAVLLLVLITLNPFFMAVLGKKMFWPSKTFGGHSESKLWGILSKSSVYRPIWAILLVALISVPFIWVYTGKLNYNDLVEVDDAFESKQGITVIEDHYPAGFSSPATLVLESKEQLDDQASLQSLDELTEKITRMDGVSKVLSPTRPAGEKISKLYINDQTNQVETGLGDANNGIDKIHDGLSNAENRLGSNNTSGLDNVQKLIDGTSKVSDGVGQLDDAMNQVTNGFNKGADGAEQLDKGLGSLNKNVATLSKASSQLYSGYVDLQKGLNSFSAYFTNISQAIDRTNDSYAMIESSMRNYIKNHPESANDKDIQTVVAIAVSGQEKLNELSQQMEKLLPNYKGAMDSFEAANSSLAQVSSGLSQVDQGVDQLQSGANELNQGLVKGAEGSRKISANTTKLDTGIVQINNGQKQLLSGLNDLSDQMKELQQGLSTSTNGLEKIGNGLYDAQEYLDGLSDSSASEKFFIPEETLKSKKFQDALDLYMSDDRKIAKMTIILDVNPYTEDAMEIVQKIKTQIDSELKGTQFSHVNMAIDGKSSENADLQTISSSDFSRTASIMLIGIGLILIVITRSLLQSIFIIGSLIITYFTSLGIGEIVSRHLVGADSLSWNVPFFSFIMIVALGVDYSIFLMMRYRELSSSKNAIIDAAKHIGSVVISAAIILGGTFAALIPSGVITLIQVAIVVMVGLIILSLLMLPIFIPGMQGLTHMLISFSKGSVKEYGEKPTDL